MSKGARRYAEHPYVYTAFIRLLSAMCKLRLTLDISSLSKPYHDGLGKNLLNATELGNRARYTEILSVAVAKGRTKRKRLFEVFAGTRRW